MKARLVALAAAFTMTLLQLPTTVVYVGIGIDGASNTACDGTKPDDQGAGHCPYKDFSSSTVRNRLQNTHNLRMEVRAGTYDVGATALVLQGDGTSWDEAVTLTNYGSETFTLTGALIPREVVRMSGTYNQVLNARICCSHDYVVEFRGGCHHRLLNSVVFTNVTSDLVKGDGGACDVTVAGNEMYGWSSQAVDMAGVNNWTIGPGNYVHNPIDATGDGFGAKFESIDVTFVENVIDGTRIGINEGGTSAAHPASYEGLRVKALRNVFRNLTNVAVKAYSCVNCEASTNTIINGVGGFRLEGVATGGASLCNNGAGCVVSTGFTAANNVMRELTGPPKNSFWLADSTELGGLTITGSVYCLATGDATPRFSIDAVIKTLAQWQTATGTDGNALIASGCITSPIFRGRSGNRR